MGRSRFSTAPFRCCDCADAVFVAAELHTVCDPPGDAAADDVARHRVRWVQGDDGAGHRLGIARSAGCRAVRRADMRHGRRRRRHREPLSLRWHGYSSAGSSLSAAERSCVPIAKRRRSLSVGFRTGGLSGDGPHSRPQRGVVQKSIVSPGSSGTNSPPPCSVAQASRVFDRVLPARESSISCVGKARRGAMASM